jgi:hypothetical protein
LLFAGIVERLSNFRHEAVAVAGQHLPALLVVRKT